jgi:DNA-binding transcriptional LysR family regulator
MNRDRWLGIELRHLAALDAIAKERSFRGAAARLGYVQSAISRQIAYLEQATGVRLIERSQGPRPVHLTDAGQRLLAHADDILARVSAAKSDLEEVAAGHAGEVRIGVFSGVPTCVLPPALAEFGERVPDVTVSASEASTDEPFFEQLQDGYVDLAFVRLPPEPGPFAVREVLRVPWVLAVASDAEAAGHLPDGGSTPTVAEIARLPLVLLKADRRSGAVETQLKSETPSIRVVVRADLVETAVALVAAGVGAALLPRLGMEQHDRRVTLVELGDLLPPLRIGLAWHRDRSDARAAKALRDMLIRTCEELGRGDTRRFTRGADARRPAPPT